MGEGKQRQELISTKKLGKGDGCWSTQKQVLGWDIDTVKHTINLPPRRAKRLAEILADYPTGKRHVAASKWHKMLGELRSMVLAVPGLWGLFSPLQEALRPLENGQPRQRIKLSREVHDFLADIRWIVSNLNHRPTRLREIIPTDLAVIGASDACPQGIGGIFFVPKGDSYESYLWREPFPTEVAQDIVSFTNPRGKLTNSELELLATVAHHDILVQEIDVRERTIYTLTDNTAAQAWQSKGSSTTTGPVAYLLRAQALHQRHHRYLPHLGYIKGKANQLADECSRYWHLSDSDLLTHFNSHYPQETTWRLCPLKPGTALSLILALHRTRLAPELWLRTTSPKTQAGSFGSVSAPNYAKTHSYTTFQSPWPCSKSSPSGSVMADAQPATSPSTLLQWARHYVRLARKYPHWGPRILV